MTTLSIQSLISQLQAAQARGVIFTNVKSIEFYGNTVSLNSELNEDTSNLIAELQKEVEDLKDNVRSENEAADMAGREVKELESQVENLERELESIKDAGGTSILDYKERATQAEEEVALARQRIVGWKEEVDALRKRKGVIPNYFKLQKEIIQFLSSSRNAGNGVAKEILEKLREN